MHVVMLLCMFGVHRLRVDYSSAQTLHLSMLARMDEMPF